MRKLRKPCKGINRISLEPCSSRATHDGFCYPHRIREDASIFRAKMREEGYSKLGGRWVMDLSLPAKEEQR